MEAKTDIRKRILKERSALGVEEVHAKSGAIFDRLCSLEIYDRAKIVLAYMDFRNEVMTSAFIQRCICDGKRVALPKVECSCDNLALPVSELSLSLYEINELERDTLPGFKGIPEPDSAVLNRLDPAEIDLAVIPGVAFDYDRNRIGYGAGYYDRFIGKLRSDCVKIAVAYGFQLVDKIPTGSHDLPMDFVITESMLIK